MTKEILIGLLIPLAGTSLGAACVYFMKNELKPSVQKVLQGFASGVMSIMRRRFMNAHGSSMF